MVFTHVTYSLRPELFLPVSERICYLVGFAGLGPRFEKNEALELRTSTLAQAIRAHHEKKGVFLAGRLRPTKRQRLTLFKHGVVIVPGARRARLDRRGAAREGSAAAASSAAGGNTSAIAELLAVAQLWAADGGCPERRFSSRRGPLLEKFTIAFPGTRLGG